MGYALITVCNGIRAEVLHNDLCKKEQQILNYIAAGNTAKTKELLKELELSSDAAAPAISRDSIVSWSEYWAIRKVYFEEMLIE